MDQLAANLEPAEPIEQQRLAALEAMDILDTPSEEAFDRITRLAAELFGTPMANITLVDATRQWFKSRVGHDLAETPRDVAFCHHTIQDEGVMVVPDAATDPRFARNPLVTGAPNIRFYAGAPLRLANGLKLGAMCVIDTRPRTLTETERRRLEILAGIVVDEMELRVRTRELEAAKVQAEIAAQAHSDFLANMSHELRSPLTSIIGFAGILGVSSDLTERDRGLVDRVGGAAKSLLALINDVLDVSRLEGGHVSLVREDVEIRPWLEEQLAQFRPQASAKSIDLTLQIDPAVPDLVRVDPNALRQILTNLLSNAVKFTDKGGVTLRAARLADGGLGLAVSDTGVGIAPENLARVFDRFAQADATISRRFGGTGLGLSISRRLAHLMNGTLTVSSVPGEGSTFELRLPARP